MLQQALSLMYNNETWNCLSCGEHFAVGTRANACGCTACETQLHSRAGCCFAVDVCHEPQAQVVIQCDRFGYLLWGVGLQTICVMSSFDWDAVSISDWNATESTSGESDKTVIPINLWMFILSAAGTSFVQGLPRGQQPILATTSSRAYLFRSSMQIFLCYP